MLVSFDGKNLREVTLKNAVCIVSSYLAILGLQLCRGKCGIRVVQMYVTIVQLCTDVLLPYLTHFEYFSPATLVFNQDICCTPNIMDSPYSINRCQQSVDREFTRVNPDPHDTITCNTTCVVNNSRYPTELSANYCLTQFTCILFLLLEYICFSIYLFVFPRVFHLPASQQYLSCNFDGKDGHLLSRCGSHHIIVFVLFICNFLSLKAN